MLPERATHACMFAHVHEKVRVILSVLQQAIYPCALAFFFFFLLKDVWFFPGRQLQSSMAAFEFARGKNMRWICLRRIHTHSSSAGVKGCKFTFPPAALKRRIELKAPAERKLVRKREEQTRVYDPIELDCIFIAASAKRSFSATVAEPPCGVPPHETELPSVQGWLRAWRESLLEALENRRPYFLQISTFTLRHVFCKLSGLKLMVISCEP